MNDSELIRRLESLSPPDLDGARERAKTAARESLGEPAGSKEARRGRGRSSGLAIIAIAGLAVAGSAMAATGVWNPFAGGGRPRAEKSDRSEHASEPQAAPERPGLDLPADAHNAPQRRSKSRGRSSESRTLAGVDAPFVPESAGEPATDQPAASHGGGNVSPLAGGGTQPGGAAQPGGGSQPGGGGGSPVREERPPKEQPGSEPPSKEPPGPRSSQIGLDCTPPTVAVNQPATCRATVRGEAGAPTGQVIFKSTGPGSFSASACTLIDDGNGATSSCAVDYTPSAAGTQEMVAIYGGDAANGPSSENFLLKSF